MTQAKQFLQTVRLLAYKALIEAIGRLSIEDIEHIAQSGWLCFAPRISNHFFEYMNRKQHTAVDVLLTLREGLNHGG